MERISLNIQGQVQGVFFRANVQTRAIQLELTGWVKNMSDGSVACVAEGVPIGMVSHGPPCAGMDSVYA